MADPPGDRPTISTHLLDLGAGAPAAGVAVTLTRLGDGMVFAAQRTDADGRIGDLLAGATLETGGYELAFALGETGFFRRAAVAFVVEDASRSYHVPLLVSPFGLSTYRGS